jgi:hypothetical protein
MTFRQKFSRTVVAAMLVGAAIGVSSGVSHATPSLTFVNVSIGLSTGGESSLFVDGQRVLYGAADGTLSISIDGGLTFPTSTSARPASEAIKGIWASGSIIHAVGSTGLSTSTDGGQTFIQNNSFSNDSRAVFASGQHLYVGTSGGGLQVSSDGGQNITSPVSGFALDVHGSGGAIYVAAPAVGILKSTNNGATFSATALTDVSEVFADNSNVYAASFMHTGKLWISTNSATTFTQLSLPSVNDPDPNQPPRDPEVRDIWASGSTIYLATNEGLLVSADGGASFTLYTTSEGLGSNNVWAVASGSGGTVLVATDAGLSIGSWPNPTVTAVSPSSGPAAGGTVITLTGTNFTSTSAVTVGGTACASFTVNSATSISCTTPAGTAGTASVVVTANGLSNAANTLFTYDAPPASSTPPPVFVVPPTPSVPPATQPPSSQPPATPGAPALVNNDNRESLTQAPGGATAIVNGQPVAVEVEAPADLPAANVPPESRSPEQVQQLQQAANEIMNRLADVAGGNPSVNVEPTPTGAVITGLLDENIPVEDVVLVETPETATLFAALNGDGTVTEVNPGGVIQVLGDGTVGVLAYGLTPGEKVELVIMSDPQLLGAYEVNEQGEVKAQAGLPEDLGTGDHTLVVASPTVQASLGLQVADRPITLPVTGGDSESSARFLVLLSLGAIFVVVARRRLALVP